MRLYGGTRIASMALRRRGDRRSGNWRSLRASRHQNTTCMDDNAMISREFSTAEAKKLADDGHLEQWIYRYLQAGEWANSRLLEGLQRQQRWWLGPLEMDLCQLKRCCGPEPDMEYRVPQMAWDKKVTGISN